MVVVSAYRKLSVPALLSVCTIIMSHLITLQAWSLTTTTTVVRRATLTKSCSSSLFKTRAPIFCRGHSRLTRFTTTSSTSRIQDKNKQTAPSTIASGRMTKMIQQEERNDKAEQADTRIEDIVVDADDMNYSGSTSSSGGNTGSSSSTGSSKVIEPLPGHVYYIATPIGNLGDITSRAKTILSNVDLILAEDTRTTAQLLRHLSIRYKGQLQSHHEHNEYNETRLSKLIALAKRERKSIAVVSDAGTPGISDPGTPLAAALAEANVPLHPIPGPSAVIAALSVSGFSSSHFTFLGFPPVKGKERKELLDQIIQIRHTVVIYEAPHRILKTMKELEERGRDAKVSSRLMMCARELTKKHEELKRGTVKEIVQWLEGLEAQKQNGTDVGIRGEFAIVFGPVTFDEKSEQVAQLRKEFRGSTSSTDQDVIEDDVEQSTSTSTNDMRDSITKCLMVYQSQGKKRSEAVQLVTKEMKLPKSIVYGIALQIKEW